MSNTFTFFLNTLLVVTPLFFGLTGGIWYVAEEPGSNWSMHIAVGATMFFTTLLIRCAYHRYMKRIQNEIDRARINKWHNKA